MLSLLFTLLQKYHYWSVLCVLLLCMTYESYAEEADDTKTVYLMEEIVVSGKAQTSVSDITIWDESIQRQRPGSVAEVLSNIPGASVTVGSKNSSEIMIRGFNSQEVLIMLDGRPVNEPYYGKIDLSTIGVGNISKIRAVKGANSVRYGPNAMGGVVNIMTGSYDDGPPIGPAYHRRFRSGDTFRPY